RRRVSTFSATLWLDGLLAATAAAALGASVLVEVVVKSTHGSRLVVLTNIAYPIGDVLLLALLVFVFSVTRWRPGRAWTLTATGVLVAASQLRVHALARVLASVTIVLVLARTALTFWENSRLLETSRREALTDSLTALANRRKLLVDLEAEIESASEEEPRMLVLFDLNGFKTYNDTFGHPAGDALLARLAGKLAAAVA